MKIPINGITMLRRIIFGFLIILATTLVSADAFAAVNIERINVDSNGKAKYWKFYRYGGGGRFHRET